MLPIIGGAVVTLVVAESVMEQEYREKLAEHVAARILSASEKYPRGGVNYFHYVLEPFPRKQWAGRWWYVAHCTINDSEVTMVCPTHDKLIAAVDGIPRVFNWSDVEKFDIHY